MDEATIREELVTMEADPNFVTKAAYRANVDHWPDHEISFVEMHMTYLKSHPSLDPKHYLANLRLMSRRR